jgi:hypothetical protein
MSEDTGAIPFTTAMRRLTEQTGGIPNNTVLMFARWCTEGELHGPGWRVKWHLAMTGHRAWEEWVNTYWELVRAGYY